jgi:hypothetical protein
MNYQSLLRNSLHYCLVAAAVLFPGLSQAQVSGFRVTYAVVPGIEGIESGRYDEVIKYIESRRKQREVEPLKDELATLCAAYILDKRLARARTACDEAVRKEGTDAAYNNRGVFRASVGDQDGALSDFAEVRIPPGDLQTFIEELKLSHPRLVASKNFDLIQQVRAKRTAQAAGRTLAVRGARVEDLAH